MYFEKKKSGKLGRKLQFLCLDLDLQGRAGEPPRVSNRLKEETITDFSGIINDFLSDGLRWFRTMVTKKIAHP